MKPLASGLCALLVSALTIGGARTLQAQQTEHQVDIHGFGDWAYGRTDGNVYLSGARPGRYDDASLALNVSASVSEKLRIVGQVAWADDAGGSNVNLDYSFAEWTLSSHLKLRAGKVKQPFGISAEVFDVGTLRPFVELPQAVYGPAGLVGESYKGVGLDGTHALKAGWSLDYDVYFGGQTLREFAPPESVVRGLPVEETEEIERTRDMLGARLVVETPVQGLSFGASSYAGMEIGSHRRIAVGGQVEYLSGPWSLRSEYVHESVADDMVGDGFYAEAARRLGRWQVAGQYGRFTSEVRGVPPPRAHSLLDHEELAASLNYWWDLNLVFKLSGHHVDGNRFAGPEPEELAADAGADRLKQKTNLVLFAVQFSF
jgi:hypothetical protein